MKTITVKEYYSLRAIGIYLSLLDASIGCGALYGKDGKQLHYSDTITVSIDNN